MCSARVVTDTKEKGSLFEHAPQVVEDLLHVAGPVLGGVHGPELDHELRLGDDATEQGVQDLLVLQDQPVVAGQLDLDDRRSGVDGVLTDHDRDERLLLVAPLRRHQGADDVPDEVSVPEDRTSQVDQRLVGSRDREDGQVVHSFHDVLVGQLDGVLDRFRGGADELDGELGVEHLGEADADEPLELIRTGSVDRQDRRLVPSLVLDGDERLLLVGLVDHVPGEALEQVIARSVPGCRRVKRDVNHFSP